MPLATPSQAVWQKPATSAMLSLLLVFLAGVTVGALAMSLGIHDWIHRRQVSIVYNNRPTIERWKKELDLTPDQTAQMELVLDDFSKYYDNVLADGNSRVMQILNERQKLKFKRMLTERR